MSSNTSDGWPNDMRIGDAVLDAEGRPWRVLCRPLGEPCDGLFQAMNGNHGQRYGEHMAKPVIVWEGAPRAN